MTHDQRKTSQACGELLSQDKCCQHCGRMREPLGVDLSGNLWTYPERAGFHEIDCPLRIVIEAALNTATRENDESESETKVRLRHLMARLGLSRDEVLGLLKEQGSRNIKELTHGQALAMVTALERRFASNTESEGA